MMCSCENMSNIKAAEVHDNVQVLSDENYRHKTFANFPSCCPVSPTTLARAGFYYTGEADTVKCFSCQLTVDGWQYGESAVGKHRKLSPHCKFINSCSSNCEPIPVSNRLQLSLNTLMADNCSETSACQGSSEVPSNIDADYLLRTGRVVDMSDTVYPKNEAMCTEEARLTTFHTWPSYSPLRPKELAHAGLYYKGIDDQVECFCCGGKLKNWEPGDRAWAEHKRHFPRCLFVQGRDIGNVPIELNGFEDEWCVLNEADLPSNPAMAAYDKRFETFQAWIYPVKKEELANAGFYSLGDQDSTMCFYCGGGLRDWKSSEDPWQQHAKWYPGCKYLIDKRGQEFVNLVQLSNGSSGDIVMQSAEESSLNKADTINQSPLVKEALQMGFSLSKIKTVMEHNLKTTGENYKSTELLVAALINENSHDTATENPQNKEEELNIEETLRRLQEEKICKICMDRNISMVFIPCGHLVTCHMCSEAIDKCPICCSIIQRRQKIFMS